MIHKLRQFIVQHHRSLFYTLWLVLSLLQASFTELFDDEAYYWVYSRFPAWGYFDHPPVIAMLIKAGYAIFQNELGVRLFTVVLNTCSIFFIEKLLAKKDQFLFYTICLSIVVAQVGGMMAVPDTPLMFFVALFFLAYDRFVKNMNAVNTFFLALVIALMLYTKYHGVLMVIFTGLSNPRLLRYYQTYVVIVLSIIFFIPHLYWQATHGFPSVQFHLFERNASEFDIINTVEFIVGQIILAGPLMGWLLVLAAILHKPTTLTEKALKFTFVGVYFFFLLSTLQGRAEANWTIPSFVGMIVLGHQYLATRPYLAKWLYYSLPLTILVVVMLRIIMVLPINTISWLGKDEFHRNRYRVQEIIKKAGNAPVVFTDSYQWPSKFMFYSSSTSMGLSTAGYRRNNYNFWPIENELFGKKAYVVANRESFNGTDTFGEKGMEKDIGLMVPNYFSFSRLLTMSIRSRVISSKKISLAFTVISPQNYLPLFSQKPYDTCGIYVGIYKKKTFQQWIPVALTVKDICDKEQSFLVTFDANIPPGEYTGRILVNNCLPGHPSLNSSAFLVSIK